MLDKNETSTKGRSWTVDAVVGIWMFVRYWLYDRPRDYISPSDVAGMPEKDSRR